LCSAKRRDITNEIEAYHDATSFYLDREHQLLSEIQKLRAEDRELKEQNQLLKQENAGLRETMRLEDKSKQTQIELLKRQNSSLVQELRQANQKPSRLQSQVDALTKLLDQGLEHLSAREINQVADRLIHISMSRALAEQKRMILQSLRS
jgi:predicted RNase H-like nuclease (RuvC/YqgF family)